MAREKTKSNVVVGLDKAPRFVVESPADAKIFLVPTSLEIVDNGSSVFLYDTTVMRSGIDLIEVPNRSLSLLLRIPESNDQHLGYAIGEVRKFAQVSWHDYFGIETFGDSLLRYIGTIANEDLVEVRPRLFKKVR